MSLKQVPSNVAGGQQAELPVRVLVMADRVAGLRGGDLVGAVAVPPGPVVDLRSFPFAGVVGLGQADVPTGMAGFSAPAEDLPWHVVRCVGQRIRPRHFGLRQVGLRRAIELAVGKPAGESGRLGRRGRTAGMYAASATSAAAASSSATSNGGVGYWNPLNTPPGERT